jgi:hypothetical protein
MMASDIKGVGDLLLSDEGWVSRLVQMPCGDYRRTTLGRIGDCAEKVDPRERADYAVLLDYWRSTDDDLRGEDNYSYQLAIGARR